MRIIDHAPEIYTRARHDVLALPRKSSVQFLQNRLADAQSDGQREGGYKPYLDPKLAVALTAANTNGASMQELYNDANNAYMRKT